MRRPNLTRLTASVFAVVTLSAAVHTQDAPAKPKVLTLADYGKWRRVTSTRLSPDGAWLSYAYDPNEGDTTLHFAAIGGDQVHEVIGGTSPLFAENSRFAAYRIDPPEKETEKLRKAKKPIVRTCGVLELATGDVRKFKGASSFRFAETSSHIAIHKERGNKKAKHTGADLLLVQLAGSTVENIGNVAEYAFNDSGSLLAYIIDADGKAGNGIYVKHLADGRTVALATSEDRYRELAWNEEADDLAVLRGDEVEGFEQRANDVLAFFDVGAKSARRVEYRPGEDTGFPRSFVVSEHASLRFSEDRKRLFLGIKEQREKVGKDAKKKKPIAAEAADGKKEPADKKPGKDKPRSNVEVWHWKDERLQSVQKVRASRDRKSTLLSVLHFDTGPRFVQLANAAMRRVATTENANWALGRDDSTYRGDMAHARGRADYHRVDLATGERHALATSVRRSLGTSPDGEWFTFSRNGEVFIQPMGGGAAVSLSKRAGVDFTNRESDRTGEKTSYGLAGWSKDHGSVLVNHRYDLWSVPLADTGRSTNLTKGEGARDKIRFRYQRLDPEEDYIDTSSPLVLSAYGDRTKQSGYYALQVGAAPEPRIFEDRMVGSLRKAKGSDRVMFTQQTIVDSPDVWVADLSFASPKKMSDANPQQADYTWTPGRVLIDYVDDRGNELQATLTLPAGYEKDKRYPMLVYFYEKMSQRHHQYSFPRYDDRPHMSTYASDGYLVLMPDIVYVPGKPGTCALDDVGAAVRKVIGLGYADPERIGLQGHSWGGYQSSFMVTQTDMFACVVTGAPLTNMISMHNVLYKRTGNANAGLIQFGQGRMATTPWEDLAGYVEQSPVHHAAKIKTPFMILHGTEDGAVDWNQGLEFYVAAKRMGKQVILLSYPGEPHHLRKKENQKDFQIRMKQYFDHYLLGRPPPKWMTEGLRYLDREREKR